MTAAEQIKKNISDIIENARFAPSVHNTQPWSVRYANNTITVSVDSEQVLKDGDPTGRQTIISLGIFAQAICFCAQAHGLAASNVEFTDTSATITFATTDNLPTLDFASLLRKRATDRSIYGKTTVDESLEAAIKNAANPTLGIEVAMRTDATFIDTVSSLTSKGIGVALSSPTFRSELARYLLPPWSGRTRGISVKSLYIPWLFAVLEPWSLKFGIGLQKEAKLEKKRWDSASAVICITAAGDMPRYWFAAGQVYLRVALAVEHHGFSQATSAALVEASTYHEDIADLLGTKQRLQSVIRIGNGVSKRAASPRVPASELLTT